MIHRNSHEAKIATFGPRGADPPPFTFHGHKPSAIPRDSKLGALFFKEYGFFADEAPARWTPGDPAPGRRGKRR